MCYHEDALRGHCNYCKNDILETETCIVKGEEIYHVECYNQMNLFMDEFGDIIKYDNVDTLNIELTSEN